MNHAEFTPTSSFLRANSVLIQDHPGAGSIKEELVQIHTLDEWASKLHLDLQILVKIDVQGFEDRVIQGGVETIRKSRYCIVEVPFRQLYEDQPLFHAIYTMLHDIGFVYRGSTLQNIRNSDGVILEADALFENMAYV